MKSLLQSNILEKVLLTGITLISTEVSDLPKDTDQQNAPLRNSPTRDLKDLRAIMNTNISKFKTFLLSLALKLFVQKQLYVINHSEISVMMT